MWKRNGHHIEALPLMTENSSGFEVMMIFNTPIEAKELIMSTDSYDTKYQVVEVDKPNVI